MSESHASRYRPLLPGPTRGDLPGAPPPRIATRKRSVVKTACGACRQRRVKTRQPGEMEEILRQIWGGRDVKSVMEDIQERSLLHQLTSAPAFGNQPSVASGSHSPNIAFRGPATGHSISGSSQGQSPASARRYGHPEHIFEKTWRDTQHTYAEDNILVDIPGYTLPLSRWTTISSDDKPLSYLLLLYWTCDTVCSRVIDRTIFEEDLKSLDPPSSQPHALCFCSPFLVNALLALYTTNQATFRQSSDPNTRGRAFAEEAARLLPLEDICPRMQARYLTLRLDDVPRSTGVAITGARQRREAHALSWISWGFHVWDWRPNHCYRITKKPNRPKTWRDETTSPLCKRDNPDYWWFPYPVSVVPQKALKREIFDAEYDLTEITEQVLEFLILPEEGRPPRRNTKRAMELYTRLSGWKFSLPEPLQAENAVLPAAILLHLSVELIIISILRPFDGLTKEEFGPFDPVTMCYAHVRNIMSTLWHFRALYTLRNEHWTIQAASACAFQVLFDIEASLI
ncbi:hypothetical protein B0J15DRAFT_514396 [Fusarium solani]|uniref:Transcription factor domain-containing protein n=1 Tax=Fusarium solani TaxID=169388 RepID=A0A9P9H116_FUSSL|nr:uncharacterized protein B0J15DRAFT_514396 [Fusarium solani]KAH7248274.1 hypothetical protein B0J15DRAFT_514396 [Fusarium solani]